MRLTYTDILNQHLRNINQVGSTDASILGDFNLNLGQRYQLMLAKLANFRTTLEYSFSTTANTQYYPYPQGEVAIEGMYLTVGSVNMPLTIINSRYDWEQLNAISIQASAIPQYYFPRRDDVGIWPIPQATYTGNMSYRYRDRNLSVADNTTGTVTVTLNSPTLLATGGAVFTPAMVGRWATVTDPTIAGQGYWFRVSAYVDATHLTLYQNWTQATATGATFRIGETPELPEEGHGLLPWGTAADFYAGMRKDLTNAAIYSNMFWTGDFNNAQRKEGDSTIAGGLIGLMNRYSDRDNTRIIKRKPKLNPLQYKVFATHLS